VTLAAAPDPLLAIARTPRAELLLRFLDLEAATGVDGARWEPFQVRHLNDDSDFRIEVKSRQIAWSFIIAAEAVALALLRDPISPSSLFLSINQGEASQKIDYAMAVFDNLRPHLPPRRGGWPEVTGANRHEITFDGGHNRRGASISSIPARPPRGKPRHNFYGDEFAHVMFDRAIYTASLPVTSKGGRYRLGSSPLGASGVFWEIATEAMRRYPGYRRRSTPWWEVASFCVDPTQARKLAPHMPTEHRVEVFGRPRITSIYENMPLEDFQQEYECAFVDETSAWITWDEIRGAQDPEHVVVTATGLDDCLAAIDQAAHLRRHNEIERVFVAGVDIGRTRDLTEVALLGISTTRQLPLRLMLSLHATEFDDQLQVMLKLLTRLPITRMLVDQSGIGMNIAETLAKRYPSKVEGVTFTGENKRLWATDAKMLIQQRRTPLPADRDLAYQIHSIKRIVTGSKSLAFDTDRNEKHHADKFWAWALALAAAGDGSLQHAAGTFQQSDGGW